MNWDYLAGFVDGEGSFYIYNTVSTLTSGNKRNYFHGRFSISQTEVHILEEIQQLLSINGIVSDISYTSASKSKSTSGMYSLRVTQRLSLKLLCETLIPILKIKKEAARTVLALCYTLDTGKKGVDLGDSDFISNCNMLKDYCTELNKLTKERG